VQERNRLEGDKHWLWCVNFSPNGQMIATACSSGSVKIWNSQGRFLNCLKDPTIEEYKAHKTEVISVSFSPNRFNLKIWTMLLSIDYLASILYLPKLFIVSTNENGQLIIWNLDNLELVELKNLNLDKLLQKACKHLGNYLKTHPRQGICQ
jgi:WD40 repeat protein